MLLTFLEEGVYSVGREMKTRVTYRGVVLGEHGSFSLAKAVSLGRDMGSGGRVVIPDYK